MDIRNFPPVEKTDFSRTSGGKPDSDILGEDPHFQEAQRQILDRVLTLFEG
jgi:hypothetical protein